MGLITVASSTSRIIVLVVPDSLGFSPVRFSAAFTASFTLPSEPFSVGSAFARSNLYFHLSCFLQVGTLAKNR